ncbi:MAG: MauE/DoxX family redox-associated membrane protein [Actinocatenispora sp.]
MTGWLATIQPVLLAGVFAWSGRLKLTSRVARRRAAEGALGNLVGKGLAPAVYGTLGGVEIGVAAVLLAGALSSAVPALGVLPRVGAALSAVLAVGFLGFLGYVRRYAPTSSCGCVSARQAPVGARSFGRAGLMLVAAALALSTGTGWATGLASHPVAGVGLLVVEGVAVVLLSPEADRSWLLPLRRLKARFRPNPLAGMAFDLPLASTLEQLHRSDAYRQVGALLSSDVMDSWDSEEWRIVCYRARREGGPATAVFAVPRLRYEPDAVKVVFVDDGSEAGSVDNDPAVLAPV